jgi:hypothetical protein
VCILYRNFSFVHNFCIFIWNDRPNFYFIKFWLCPPVFWLISGECHLFLWWIYGNPSQCVAFFLFIQGSFKLLCKDILNNVWYQSFPSTHLVTTDEIHCVDASL